MTLKRIKERMRKYRDFYGQDFLESDAIEKAKTKEELMIIIDHHEVHLDLQAADACSHLRNFKKEIGL